MKRSMLIRTFAIVTAATLLMFGALFSALRHTSVEALKTQAMANASADLEMIQAYLGSVMNGVKEHAYLFMMGAELSGDNAQRVAYFNRFTSSDIAITTRLLLVDGEIVALDLPLALASMSLDSAFYQGLSKRGRLVTTAPYYSKLTATRTVAVVRSMIDPKTGSEIVLVLEIGTRDFFDKLTKRLAQLETLVVLDGAGETIYFLPTSPLLSGLTASGSVLDIGQDTRDALTALPQGVQEVSLNGRGVIVERLKYADQWNLYFLVDTNQFYAAVNALIRSFLVLAGLAAVVLVFVCVGVSTGVIRPIRTLSRQADALSPGAGALRLTRTGHEEIDRLADSFNSLIERLEEAGRERERIERSHYQMEYKVLQSQIQPHFLFNIHMCVDGLLEKGDVRKAREMLSALDALLRDSTDKTESIVPLSAEMDMLDRYLTLQSMRMGDNMDVIVGDWTPYANLPTPKLLLQPIVENAIQHGLAGISWRGRIELSFEEIEGKLHIFIRDNGRGIDPETLKQLETGEALFPPSQRGMVSIGLSNVRSRIKSVYGEECGMYIFSRENLGTTVELVIDDAPRAQDVKI